MRQTKNVKNIKKLKGYKQIKEAKWKFSFYDSGDNMAFYVSNINGVKVQMSIQQKRYECLFDENHEERLLSKSKLKHYHSICFVSLEDEGKTYYHNVQLSDSKEYLKSSWDNYIDAQKDFVMTLKSRLEELNK